MALTFTPQPKLNQSCPDFNLKDVVEGKSYSQIDFFQGKPVLIMFICNHCPYVKAIEDRLIQLGLDLKEVGISVIAICSNDSAEHPEDNAENLKKRALERNYPFVYLHDAKQIVAHAFGAVCTPDFFLYDKNSQLQYRGRLDDSWKDASKVTQRELYNSALVLLRDQKISLQQTPALGCSIKWLGNRS